MWDEQYLDEYYLLLLLLICSPAFLIFLILRRGDLTALELDLEHGHVAHVVRVLGEEVKQLVERRVPSGAVVPVDDMSAERRQSWPNGNWAIGSVFSFLLWWSLNHAET